MIGLDVHAESMGSQAAENRRGIFRKNDTGNIHGGIELENDRKEMAKLSEGVLRLRIK